VDIMATRAYGTRWNPAMCRSGSSAGTPARRVEVPAFRQRRAGASPVPTPDFTLSARRVLFTSLFAYKRLHAFPCLYFALTLPFDHSRSTPGLCVPCMISSLAANGLFERSAVLHALAPGYPPDAVRAVDR
jgi:hypothetical protein